MVIAAHQSATFSNKTRTAIDQSGTYLLSDYGAYRFVSFTIKDYANATFESEKELLLGTLEIHYQGTLFGKSKLQLKSNTITLLPGSTIDLTGTGYEPSTGPGRGKLVCDYFYASCICLEI